jgi:hypothetical protein
MYLGLGLGLGLGLSYRGEIYIYVGYPGGTFLIKILFSPG